MNEKTKTQKWIENYLKESWEEVVTDIDFSKYNPINTKDSLHICEERYEVDGKIYKLLYAIGYDYEPKVEILKT